MKFETITQDVQIIDKDFECIDISDNWKLSKANHVYTHVKSRDDVNVNLPHHWQSETGWETYTGLAEYSKTVKLDFDNDCRYFLRINGAFYSHKVVINEKHYSTNEGYFTPRDYEVPETLFTGGVLDIKIFVESHDEQNLRRKKFVSGIFGHWDAHEPDFNSGGIWQRIELIKKGKVSADNPLLTIKKIIHDKNNDHSALTVLQFELDTDVSDDVQVRVKLSPDNFSGKTQEFSRKLTRNRRGKLKKLEHRFNRIELWYPHDTGFPYTYRVTVDFLHNNRVSDRHEFSFGFRRLVWQNWHLSVNGKKVYAKGLNVGPLKFRMAQVHPSEWEEEFETLRALNCNMIRVHCHVQIKEFYEYADRYGILIYQDFPLQWMYSRSVEVQAVKQIKEMVRLLYNHPSIALWSCHNEPYYVGKPEDMDKTGLKNAWEFLVYNYDKVIMDRKLRFAVKQIDKTRFTNRASCIYSIVGFRGTDIHAYWGWYFGEMTLFHTIKRIAKRNLRFVSEFGTQSIPNYENALKFMPQDVHETDWEYLKNYQNCQPRLLHHYIPLLKSDDLQTYIRKTQDYQCDFTRYYLDLLRLVKNQPNAGIIAFMYRSSHPGIDWSIVDFWGGRKRVYTTIRRGFQKIYPFIYLNKNNVLNKKKNLLSIYITNDFPDSLKHVQLWVRIKKSNKTIYLKRFDIELPPASEAVKVTSIKFKADDALDNVSVLLLAQTKTGTFKNRYQLNSNK